MDATFCREDLQRELNSKWSECDKKMGDRKMNRSMKMLLASIFLSPIFLSRVFLSLGSKQWVGGESSAGRSMIIPAPSRKLCTKIRATALHFQRSHLRDQIPHSHITSLDDFGVDSTEPKLLSGRRIDNLERRGPKALAELATSVV